MSNPLNGAAQQPHSRRDWTTIEVEVVQHFGPLGAEFLAELLDRTPAAITSKATQVGAILSGGRRDVNLIGAPKRIISFLRRAPTLSLCPRCSIRLATEATGHCAACNIDLLAEWKEQHSATVDRRKKLTRLRQQDHRSRRCTRCGTRWHPRTATKSTLCPTCRSSS